MPKFEKIHKVNHSSSNMFDLVADVEKYPEFLPLCENLNIRSEREKQGKRMLLADMSVGYKGIKQSFTSKVLINPEACQIDVNYVDGPFKYMDNRWQFEQLENDHSIIKFFIDYELKSKTLSLLLGSMFDTAFQRFTRAFEERADQIYGKSEPDSKQ